MVTLVHRTRELGRLVSKSNEEKDDFAFTHGEFNVTMGGPGRSVSQAVDMQDSGQ